MKKLLFAFYFLNCLFVNAELPPDEYEVMDIQKNETFRLGTKFSYILRLYPDIVFNGTKKNGHTTYKVYEHCGITFCIWASTKVEGDAPILWIEFNNNKYRTKRGITIGNTKEDVIQKYGNADYIWNNNFSYFYRDSEVQELAFIFNENGIVTSIQLAAGT